MIWAVCDPASWFSVADASMGKDGRPDLHSVPTHARRRGLPPGVLVPGRAEGPPEGVPGWSWVVVNACHLIFLVGTQRPRRSNCCGSHRS